jgi:hypothetical protein
VTQQILEIEASDTLKPHPRLSAPELISRSFRPAVTAPEERQWVRPREVTLGALTFTQGSLTATLTGPYKGSVIQESTGATITSQGASGGAGGAS